MTTTDIFAELDTLRAKLPKQGDDFLRNELSDNRKGMGRGKEA